jgi:hypothetical protein
MPQTVKFPVVTIAVIVSAVSFSSCKSRKFSGVKNDNSSVLTTQKFLPRDLAILFPLPQNEEDYIRLLGLGWKGNSSADKTYSLLSKEIFSEVIAKGFQSLNDHPDRKAYSRNEKTFQFINNFELWRMVSVRYSPCNQTNATAGVEQCEAELRLVAQPIVEPKDSDILGTTATPSDRHQGTFLARGIVEKWKWRPEALKNYSEDSKYLSEDQALHLIYQLEKNDHKILLKALGNLKAATETLKLDSGEMVGNAWGSSTADKEKIWIHPLLHFSMKKFPGAAKILSQLRAAEDNFKFEIMKVARGEKHSIYGETNLNQVLFLGTGVRAAGTGWAFSSFTLKQKDAGVTLRRAKLNAWPNKKLLEAFATSKPELDKAQMSQVLVHDHHLVSTSMETPFQEPSLRDDIMSLTNRHGVIAESKMEFEQRAIRLFNPLEHSQGGANCGNCHTSTTAFLLSQKANLAGVPALVSKNFGEATMRFAYGSETSWQGNAILGYYPMFFGFNLRQFGYYTRYPSVSIRTQIEAAADAKYLNDNFSKLGNALDLN